MTAVDRIATLERQVREDPGNARQRYLLGAELAQSGEYSRAVDELSQAIVLDPSLDTARFQLGLLFLTMSQPASSLAAWAPLEQSKDAALIQFKRGLEALLRDDLRSCIELLEAGIALNQTNQPLNRDMRMVCDRVRQQLAGKGVGSDGDAAPAVRTDFSLYEQVPK